MEAIQGMADLLLFGLDVMTCLVKAMPTGQIIGLIQLKSLIEQKSRYFSYLKSVTVNLQTA